MHCRVNTLLGPFLFSMTVNGSTGADSQTAKRPLGYNTRTVRLFAVKGPPSSQWRRRLTATSRPTAFAPCSRAELQSVSKRVTMCVTNRPRRHIDAATQLARWGHFDGKKPLWSAIQDGPSSSGTRVCSELALPRS